MEDDNSAQATSEGADRSQDSAIEVKDDSDYTQLKTIDIDEVDGTNVPKSDDSSEVQNPIQILEKEERKCWYFANPAPLGLAAFGMTTFLLNAHNAKWFGDFDSMIFGRFGGTAQIIVGVLEFIKNNTFGTVAFTSYGAFWISLCVLKFLPQISSVPVANPMSMCLYLFVWGVFTTCMTCGTFAGKKLATLSVVFILLAVLFYILALENFVKHILTEFDVEDDTAVYVLSIIAGVWGMILGCLALYLGMAEVMNEKFKKVVFPIVFPEDIFTILGRCKESKSTKEIDVDV